MFTLIVRLMAGHAVLLIGGIKAESATLNVAGVALGILVSTLKLVPAGELPVIEGPDFHPGPGCVAGEAFRRESQGNVIDLLRGLEVLLMARQTVRGKWAKAPSLIVGVTVFTA